MLHYKLLIAITIAPKTSEIDHETITRKQWVSNEEKTLNWSVHHKNNNKTTVKLQAAYDIETR